MNSQQHILGLPNEVLVEIFQYVPNKMPLKLVCQDFYKIICRMETCNLFISDVSDLSTFD